MKPYALNPTIEYRDVQQLLQGAASIYGNDIAYSFRHKPSDAESVKVSFVQLKDQVDDLAVALLELGCAGKHCAIVGKLTFPWIKLYYALLSIGAVVVPLDREWSGEELATTVAFADCEYLFHDADIAAKGDVVMADENCHIAGRFVIAHEGEGTTAELEARGASMEQKPRLPKIDPDVCALI